MTKLPLACTLLLAAGCLADDATEIGTSAEPLLSRSSTADECTPFTALMADRREFFSRTVMNSPAYAQCVEARMNAQYMNCDDPFASYSRSVQLDQAWRALWAGNPVRYTCPYEPGKSLSTRLQGWGDWLETKEIYLQGQYHESASWSDFTGFQPWHWGANGHIHEFMHTHDYTHMDVSCLDEPGDCLKSTCFWTEACGGSGEPPSWMSIDEAGESKKEFCAVANGRAEDEYYRDGEPSAPYIYGSCASNLIETSATYCGLATDSCAEDELYLLADWSEPDGAGTGVIRCECVRDPQRRVQLVTGTNHYLRIAGGGGGDVTATARRFGAWQMLYFEDVDHGRLEYGDEVRIRVHNGQFLRTTYSGDVRADGASPLADDVVFTLSGFGTGEVRPGDTIYLQDAYGHWLFADGGGGGDVQAGPLSWSNLSWFGFRVDQQARARMIYLKSYHNRFVEVGDDRRWTNAATAPSERSAFWLIDHNGGLLESGDTISLELHNDGHFANTYHGVDQAVGNGSNDIGAVEKFVVTRLGGGGLIASDDRIAIRSTQGRYLTADPPSRGSKVRNFATGIRSWERFQVVDVQQHDQERPTWPQW